jgi:signal transduction histidine kinase
VKNETTAERAFEFATDYEETHCRGATPAWRRYAVAVLCILTAFGIRYCLTPILGEELPFMLFIAAALVAAWYGGAPAGIVALLLGLFLADYFFLTRGKPGMSGPAETLHFVRYIFTASLGIALIEVLHRGRRRTQAAMEELRREVARRERSEEALVQAQAQLSRHAEELEKRVVERTAKLAATVEALQGLLYHIAHNLRAPLRAMQGYTMVLMEEYASKLDLTAQGYSRHICDAATRMDELIHDLLEYGRLGHTELQMTSVCLDSASKEALLTLAHEIKTTKAEVAVAGPLPKARAHPAVLKQVLTNLLDNAIKFVPPGTAPRIEIRAERRDLNVRLWIQDNGTGIEPQYHQRIFEVFERLNPGRGNDGTGIGLAMAKRGMQQMRGEVGVESALGAGSRFWIELPLADSG